MSKFAWSKKKVTKPGLYWWRTERGTSPTIFNVMREQEGLKFGNIYARGFVNHLGGEWQPVQPPKP